MKEASKFEAENHVLFGIGSEAMSLTAGDFYFNYEDKTPVNFNRKVPLEFSFNRNVKRTFDVLFSLLVIILFFPWVFPIIMLAIKLTSRGPVFFKQPRAGKRRKPFLCFKFRTMFINNLPHIQATKYDPRVTKVGRLLRKTNLDELPQFFNVLLGDMSVVGPRPYIFHQVVEYSKIMRRTNYVTLYYRVLQGMPRLKGLGVKLVN